MTAVERLDAVERLRSQVSSHVSFPDECPRYIWADAQAIRDLFDQLDAASATEGES